MMARQRTSTVPAKAPGAVRLSLSVAEMGEMDIAGVAEAWCAVWMVRFMVMAIEGILRMR